VTEPLVTIGVPVHNGARYLAEALDSVLGQTYANLEIVLCDNASTDETPDICRDAAARDARVRFERAPENRGAVANFARVWDLAGGEYFAWVAADDRRAPGFVASCLERLEEERDAVLCGTGIRLVDEAGRETYGEAWDPLYRPFGPTPKARALEIAKARYWYDVYGLIRADALQRIHGPRPVWGWDVVLLLELCLLGDTAYVPERLIDYRVYREKTEADVAAGLGEAAQGWTGLTRELVRAIRRSPLGPAEKAALVPRFLVDFCVRNPTVRIGMRREARRAG
jgi:glycosyltransferase involved in cell wall biosynthesis